MTGRDRFWLLLSLIASWAAWALLINWKFGLMLTGAILIHEYGHYYWMGREGINKKKMLFIPLMGAVAITQEGWPSRGSEARIAIAGPFAGLLSALIPTICYLINPLPIFAASIAVICLFNLFNLIFPVAILDGGRVWKSILYSINERLGRVFVRSGFLVLVISVYFSFGLIFLALIIGWFLYSEIRMEKLEREGGGPPPLLDMSGKEILACLAVYIITCLGLVALMFWANHSLAGKVFVPSATVIIEYFK